MNFEINQIVLGTVWEVRPYGLMVNVDRGWGLLHRSKIPIRNTEAVSNFADINDVLTLRVIRSSSNEIAFQFVDSRKIDVASIFNAKYSDSDFIVNKFLSESEIEVVILNDKLRNRLFGVLNKKDYSSSKDFGLLAEGSYLPLSVVGYDFSRKRLVCRSEVSNGLSDGADFGNLTDTRCFNEEYLYEARLIKVHLNALEFDITELGTVVLPFKDLFQGELLDIKSLDLKLNQTFIVELTNDKNIVVHDSFKEKLGLNNIKTKKEVLMIGASGTGKTTIINSLSFYDSGVMGELPTDPIFPITQTISKIELKDCVLWDSPGYGVGIQNDLNLEKEILSWIKERKKENLEIVVVFDANSRDYGSTFDFLNRLNIAGVTNFIFCINKVDALYPFGVLNEHVKGTINDRCRVKILEKIASVKSRVKGVLGREYKTIAVSARISNSSRSFNLKNFLKEIQNA